MGGMLRAGDTATAFPSASTWDPALAERAGAAIGAEARAKGFNILLGGGVHLVREPRNGRNFEYLGEDPLLAGTLVGHAIRGVQSNHIISTIKHYALNAQETGRMVLSANLGEQALRESDLLAFEIGVEIGRRSASFCRPGIQVASDDLAKKYDNVERLWADNTGKRPTEAGMGASSTSNA